MSKRQERIAGLRDGARKAVMDAQIRQVRTYTHPERGTRDNQPPTQSTLYMRGESVEQTVKRIDVEQAVGTAVVTILPRTLHAHRDHVGAGRDGGTIATATSSIATAGESSASHTRLQGPPSEKRRDGANTHTHREIQPLP
jgi:hypothetical protein